MSTDRSCTGVLVATTLLASGIGVCDADVTLQERITVEGTGLMSIAGMQGTSTTSIAGKHARVESNMKMASGFMRMLARGAGQTTEIVRLDDDTIYVLDMKKKRYQETSVAARSAELAKASVAQQGNPIAFDDSQCDWSEPKLTVDRSGAKVVLAGLSAAPLSIVARQSCKDRRTGAVCDIALSFEGWIAPSSAAAGEALQFRAAYARELGLGTDSRAESLLSRYKRPWGLMADEIRKLKGFPVKTRFALGLGGENCSGPASAGGGGSGAPSPSALASRMVGFFGRKKSSPDESAPVPTQPGPEALAGMIVPLRVTSEIESIGGGPLNTSTFEVPADFKKTTR
jgi:hypothetical protein